MELEQVNVSDIYNSDAYDVSGLLCNSFDNNVYYVSKVSRWVLLLDSKLIFDSQVDVLEQETKDSVVSESFALKMLAINNGTRVEDLKL